MVKKEVHTQSLSSNEEKGEENKFIQSSPVYFLPQTDPTSDFREHSGTTKKLFETTKKIINSDITTNVFDVSAYILKKTGSISTMKLQKLVYYSQAWSLVWDEAPLFNEEIEAWANGPVIKNLFIYHRGSFIIETMPIGNSDLLSSTQKETIDAVLKFYGDKSAQWLIELSHNELPWIEARKGLGLGERGSSVISLDSMAQYYSSI